MTENEIINCEEALRLLAQHLDGELEDHDHEQVERHLSSCRSCYSRAEFERELKARVRDAGEAEVRPEFVDRVQGLLQRFTTTTSE